MKKIILLFIFLLFPIITYAMDECEGIMYKGDIPCIILYPYTDNCSEIEMYVYLNNTLLDTRFMNSFNTFFCNQIFNYTALGTYTFNYSTMDTGSIVVKEDVNKRYYLYVTSLIIFLALIGLGYKLENKTFVTLAGILSVMIAINLLINGFPYLDDTFLREAIVMVLLGIGFYFMVAPAVEYFEEIG